MKFVDYFNCLSNKHFSDDFGLPSIYHKNAFRAYFRLRLRSFKRTYFRMSFRSIKRTYFRMVFRSANRNAFGSAK